MFILFICYLLLVGIAPPNRMRCVSAGSLDIRDVIPDVMMGTYKDYELLHLEESQEQDTVYIIDRAVPSGNKADDCNDCAWFSPLFESEIEGAVKHDTREIPDEDAKSISYGTMVHSRQNTKRAGKDKNIKKADICDTGLKNGRSSSLAFMSYKYPTNEQLEKDGFNKVFDFKPFDDPLSDSYHELRDIGAFQNRNSQGKSINRAVSVEHILEWQVLLDFIRSSKERCNQMMNYFTTVVDIDTTLKVLSNKGNGPEQDVKIIGKEKGIEYIAHQYPGDGKEGIANKFTYEFVSLHDDVNGRKERLWSEGRQGGKKPAMLDESVVAKYFRNQHSVTTSVKNGNKKSKSTTWVASSKNEGLCSAVIVLRDVIAVNDYHANPVIEKIMKAQVDRIGAAFEYLEEGPLKTTKFPDPTDPSNTKFIDYKPMATSLKSQWEVYMKEQYASRITEVESLMTRLTTELKNVKAKRSLVNSRKRGTGSTRSDLCGEEPNKTNMEKRIALVLKAYNDRKTWKNPI